MSEKSTVIPLGLIFANENTSAGIGKILREVQEKYVPMIVKDDKKQVSCLNCLVNIQVSYVIGIC